MFTTHTPRESYTHARYWLTVARECMSLLVRGRKRAALTDTRLALMTALVCAAEWREIARKARA